MDTDTTMARYAHEEKLNAFAQGKYDIMIGTQMVAKGLDFPNVTLVGILSADQALYSDDFRCYERAFSLLTQVIGRSGRGKDGGRAMIQTLTPENPVIPMAAAQDYERFYREEIALRQARLYPPFADLCVIGFSGEQELQVRDASRWFLDQLIDEAKTNYPGLPLRVIGPAPASVYRVNQKFRYKILLKCRSSAAFRKMIAELLVRQGKNKDFSHVSVYADMNPDNIL
jgi:primosomal protein N' (replication factor Y)